MVQDPIYTVGHSNLVQADFFELLAANGIDVLVDVRRFPSSRRHPHFNGGVLARALADAGIDYVHEVDLGGKRTGQPGDGSSPNAGWQHAAFQSYADYALTANFSNAIQRVLTLALRSRTVVMCAEALWSQCHRRIIADYVLARGHPVLHLRAGYAPEVGQLNELAAMAGHGRLHYPPVQPTLF